MTSDKELEDRLRATFVARAETVDHGPAWDGPASSAVSQHDFPGMTPPRGQRFLRRWRAPLLAAAAVVLIAVATSAIVTGGFRGGDNAATPASGHAGGTPPVTVPIACGFTMAGNAPGSAGGGSAGGNAVGGGAAVGSVGETGAGPAGESGSGAAVGHAPGSSGESHVPTTAGSSYLDHCTSPGSVQLSLTGDTPSESAIRWRLVIGGEAALGGDATHSESLLGNTILTKTYQGRRYFWGVVGPTVDQVQIQSMRGQVAYSDPDFHPTGSAYWFVGSGKGTASSLPGQDNVIWTDIGGGWHGFAVALPTDTRLLDATALGSGLPRAGIEIHVDPNGRGSGVTLTRTPTVTGGATTERAPQPTTRSAPRAGAHDVVPTVSGNTMPKSSVSGWPTITSGPWSPPTGRSGSKGTSSTPSTSLFAATTEPFPAQCPSTRQTGAADVPDVLHNIGGTWFGHDDLWVNAPAVVGYGGTKFSSVTLDDHGDFTDGKGAPTLTAQLVGGSATSEMTGTNYSSETVHGRTVRFWPTTISLPQHGTWLMTEALGDTTLRFCMTAI